MRKVFAVLLIIALLTVLFSGCGKNGDPSPSAQPGQTETPAPAQTQEPDSPYKLANGDFPKDERGLATQHYKYEMPLSTTDEVFSMWTTLYTMQYIPEEGYGSMPLPTYDRELTGVNIEYIMVDMNNRQQNFSVIRASDDMSDIMCWAVQYYGGPERALLDEGYFANIYDYRDYAPNYFYLTANADPTDRNTYDRVFLSPTEVASMWVIYANPVINGGYAARGDWLKKMGLSRDSIVTWDDYFEVMKAVRTEYPTCEYPWGMTSTIDLSGMWYFTSFDTVPCVSSTALGPYFILDGKVTFANIGDNDRQFLNELHRFMDEDLLQPNWTHAVTTTDYEARMNVGEVFYTFMTCNDTQSYSATNEDPDCEWIPMGSPLRTPDQILKVSTDVSRILASNTFNFSVKCENLPLLISWCDWLYSPEGGELWSYGLEGHVWEYDESGNRVATELITRNPDGMSYTWACSHYAVYMGAMSLLFYNKRNFMAPGTGAKSWDVAMFILDWRKAHYNGGSNYPSGARLTDEENNVVKGISADVTTYVAENYMLFATQSRDMSEWDDYVSGVYEIGMQTIIDTYQFAYDRYLAT